MKSLGSLILLSALLLACGPASTSAEPFDEMAGAIWADLMAAYPEWATYNGYVEHNARWTDVSPEGFDARREQFSRWRDELRALEQTSLGPDARLSRELLDGFLSTIVDAPERDRRDPGFGYGYTLVSQMEGVHHNIPNAVSLMPAQTVSDFETILERLKGTDELIDQTLTTLRADLEAGIVLPAIILRNVPSQISELLTIDAHDSAVLLPFQEMPEAIPDAERSRLRDQAATVFAESVAPALESLRRFLLEVYIPAARDTVALTALPGGQEWYDFKIALFTTTEMSAQEIHDLGLSEVARIRGEMEGIIREVGFDGDFEAFSEFLRSDPQFFFTDKEALLAAYRDASKRADPRLVALFGRLPRLPYGVEPVPSYSEQSQTTAYYQSGSFETGRPGTYFANTYNLPSRPRWEIEALTLHEAVPGHHLQLAIAQELEGVPEFRRHIPYNAYTEGWGLYAESLGYEMGFYEDPYSRFGQLTYEMWRAVRLVVDTGLHQLGWSREQAIDYFAANASKSRHDITVEVDRYIAWPGQALGYKIGQLEIRRLRSDAERRLGDRFDVRAFHDVVLGQGGLPLTVLAQRVEEWVRTR